MKNEGTCVTLLAMQKTSLSMFFPYINYKKRCLVASMHTDCLVTSKKKNHNILLFLPYYITVIITTCL